MDDEHQGDGRIVGYILGTWFCLALAVGVGGYFRDVSAATVAVTVWALVALALVACWKIQLVRDWVRTVNRRTLIAVHLTRLVGIYFLALAGRGELPAGWARPAGIGDTLVAAMALVLVAIPALQKRRKIVGFWNLLGLVDILFVVFSALRFGLADPQSMAALRNLPLSLLPMFLVPLIIVTHALIFMRLRSTSK